jgi:hypothetical protein
LLKFCWGAVQLCCFSILLPLEKMTINLATWKNTNNFPTVWEVKSSKAVQWNKAKVVAVLVPSGYPKGRKSVPLNFPFFFLKFIFILFILYFILFYVTLGFEYSA